jgi:hypothetical protein
MKAWKAQIFLAGLFLSGCGGDEQDADAIIKLVVDHPQITEKQVAQQLETIEMLFDAQGGFSSKAEGFTAVDPDNDQETELLLSIYVGGRITLPVVGLSAGSHRNTPIAIRVRGLNPAEEVVALGGIDPRVLFAPSGRSQVEISFNLTRKGLPPRIVAVAPLAVPPGGVLDSLAFYTTQPLDMTTLPGNISVRTVASGGGSEEEVAGTFSESGVCPFGTYMYVFTPTECHRSAHWLGGVKLAVGTDIKDTSDRPLGSTTVTISIDQTKEFGACTPSTGCDEIGITSADDIDIACDLQTGRYKPAPCSVAAGGCLGESVFDWVNAADTAGCQAFRPDTVEQDGACVILDPWPCIDSSACSGVGSGTCDQGIGQCIPESCTTSCTPESQVCVSGEGCLPKIGGCTQDCQAYGACPEFDQECVLGESGGHVCQ